MDTFADASSVTANADGSFAWSVPDGWQMGRGAWGGLVIGALIGAVTMSEPDPRRRVRSVSAELVAPALVGLLHVQVVALRRGSAVSTWSARAHDESGALVANVVAVLGAPRLADEGADFASWGTQMAPSAPPFADVPRLPLGPPMGPVFARHLDLHPVHGVPLSGEEAVSLGWVRYGVPQSHTAASLFALVDAWWPAFLSRLARMRPIATVTFAANLLLDPAEVGAGEPVLHHSFVSSAREGFASEQRRLWTADGRLVVDNLQSIVLIA